MKKTRLVEVYPFDMQLQCRSCSALNGFEYHSDGRDRVRLVVTARSHASETGHEVEVIECRVRAYGPA